MNNKYNSIGAVVLAGGLARRMAGKDKGLIALGGKPLVQWVIDSVSPQVDELVINANRNTALYRKLGPSVCPDVMEGYLGPLAGLYTGFKVLSADYVFMCPCDSPFVPADMVVRLLATLQIESAKSPNADIAVAHDGRRLQPVFCVASRSVLPSLVEFLNSGQRKIDKWYALEKCVEVDFSASTDAFLNINTEEERMAVERSLSTA